MWYSFVLDGRQIMLREWSNMLQHRLVLPFQTAQAKRGAQSCQALRPMLRCTFESMVLHACSTHAGMPGR